MSAGESSGTLVEAQDAPADYLFLRQLGQGVTLRLSSPIDLPANNSASNLLCVSNQHGLLFAATADGFIVHQLKSVRSTLTTAEKNASPNLEAWARKQTTSDTALGARVSFLRTADNDKTLLAALDNGRIAGWSISDIGPSSLQPSFVLDPPRANLKVRELAPNPAEKPELCAVLYAETGSIGAPKGSLALCNVQSGQWQGEITPPQPTATTAVCWSVRGKQLALGLDNGEIVQMTPDNQPKDRIAKPSGLDGTPYVESVLWLENHVFVTTYNQPATSDEPEHQYEVYSILRDPKAGTSLTFVHLNDPAPPFGDTSRRGHRYTSWLKAWEPLKHMIFVANTSSTDVGLIGCSAQGGEAGGWQNLDLEDTSRPALPFSSIDTSSDTSPVGLCFDLTASNNIDDPQAAARGEDGTGKLSPVPILLVYTNDGVLLAYHVINVDSKAGPYSGLVQSEGATSQVSRDAVQAAPSLATPVTAPPATGTPGPAFGQSSPFGSAAATPAFGQSSAFGPRASTSAFGTPSPIGGSTSSPFSAFASPAAAPSGGASSFSGGFGGFASKSQGAVGFGSPGPSTVSPFAVGGQSTTSSKPEAKVGPAQSSAFGAFASGSNSFGSTSSTPTSFGNTNSSAVAPTTSTPAAGTPATSTSTFGSTKPPSAFGSTSTFGQSSGFGSAFGQPSPFGATGGKPSAFGSSLNSALPTASASPSPNEEKPTSPAASSSSVTTSAFGAFATKSAPTSLSFGNAAPKSADSQQSSMFGAGGSLASVDASQPLFGKTSEQTSTSAFAPSKSTPSASSSAFGFGSSLGDKTKDADASGGQTSKAGDTSSFSFGSFGDMLGETKEDLIAAKQGEEPLKKQEKDSPFAAPLDETKQAMQSVSTANDIDKAAEPESNDMSEARVKKEASMELRDTTAQAPAANASTQSATKDNVSEEGSKDDKQESSDLTARAVPGRTIAKHSQDDEVPSTPSSAFGSSSKAASFLNFKNSAPRSSSPLSGAPLNISDLSNSPDKGGAAKTPVNAAFSFPPAPSFAAKAAPSEPPKDTQKVAPFSFAKPTTPASAGIPLPAPSTPTVPTQPSAAESWSFGAPSQKSNTIPFDAPKPSQSSQAFGQDKSEAMPSASAFPSLPAHKASAAEKPTPRQPVVSQQPPRLTMSKQAAPSSESNALPDLFLQLYLTMEEEIQILKDNAQRCKTFQDDLRARSLSELSKGDLRDASKWTFGELDNLVSIMKGLDADVRAMNEQGQESKLRLRKIQSEQLKVETKREEIARFIRAKNDPGFRKMIKVRQLGPEHADHQARLRKAYASLQKSIDELDAHITRLHSQALDEKLGRPASMQAPSLDVMRRTVRNITRTAEVKMLELEELQLSFETLCGGRKQVQMRAKAHFDGDVSMRSSKEDIFETLNSLHEVLPKLSATSTDDRAGDFGEAQRKAGDFKRAFLQARAQPILNRREAGQANSDSYKASDLYMAFAKGPVLIDKTKSPKKEIKAPELPAPAQQVPSQPMSATATERKPAFDGFGLGASFQAAKLPDSMFDMPPDAAPFAPRAGSTSTSGAARHHAPKQTSKRNTAVALPASQQSHTPPLSSDFFAMPVQKETKPLTGAVATPFTAAAAKASPSPSKESASSETSPTKPAFSFAKPSEEAAKPSFSFGAPSQDKPAQVSSPKASSGDSAPSAFSFAKPETAKPMPSAFATSSKEEAKKSAFFPSSQSAQSSSSNVFGAWQSNSGPSAFTTFKGLQEMKPVETKPADEAASSTTSEDDVGSIVDDEEEEAGEEDAAGDVEEDYDDDEWQDEDGDDFDEDGEAEEDEDGEGDDEEGLSAVDEEEEEEAADDDDEASDNNEDYGDDGEATAEADASEQSE